MTDYKALLLLTFLISVTTLPFIHRAYFVDDYYHVVVAKNLLSHPLRPYDFIADDELPKTKGWERGSLPRLVNPLVHHYLLAGVMKCVGEDVWKLRLFMIFMGWITVCCTYVLGKRFSDHPLACASLVAITPAFWLTSYSLLLDNTLLTFFMLSVYFWFKAVEKNQSVLFLLCGVFMAMTYLTKYTGALIVPVIFCAWYLSQTPKPTKGLLLSLGVSGVLVGGWGLWTWILYGAPHFWVASQRGIHLSHLNLHKALVTLSFLGGSFVFLFASPVILWRQRRGMICLALVILFIGLAMILNSRVGGFSAVQSILFSFFVTTAFAFILHVSFDRTNLFLKLWFFLGLLSLFVVMPWTAARYYLLILPPSIWFFEKSLRAFPRWVWYATWVGTACLGFFLAQADYDQANTVLRLKDQITAQLPLLQNASPRANHHWYYLGDTFFGFEPYLAPLGFEAAFPNQVFKSGDLLLKANYRMWSWWKIPNPERFEVGLYWRFGSHNPLRVMDIPSGAGFYASAWGAMPWTLTFEDPLERFDIYRVRT